jgi:hypothetical protein
MHKHEDVEHYYEPKEKKAPGHLYLSEKLLRKYAAAKKRQISNPGEAPEVTVKWLPRIR